jgi:ubiquinone/menaquinone biosynthesis C-methylase UbiE
MLINRQISPVKRSKSAARQAYDRMSGYYDMLAGSSETPLMQEGLEMMGVKPGETVLEIGCGTGKGLEQLSRQVGPSGEVHGVDLSTGMLKQSRAHLARAGAGAKLCLVEADGSRLPYRDGCFMAVFLSFTLELFDTPEIPVVLEACRRVLRPGGRIGVVSMYNPAQLNWIVRLYEWLHARMPAYVDCRPILAGEMLKLAGFTVRDERIKSMWGLPVELVVAEKQQ